MITSHALIPDHTTAARPFTGVTLDRAGTERKDPEWVHALLEHPDARAVVAGAGGVLVTDGDDPALVRAHIGPDMRAEPILLGLEHGRALFAVDLDDVGSAVPEDGPGEGVPVHTSGRRVSLREAGVTLPHDEGGLAAYAAALLNWHHRHRFCANCGHATAVTEGGHSRHCAGCKADHFPRTDPCVIMTVAHGDSLLLGRRTEWPAGRFSVLAGFVSPGESLEESVVREVEEESGIVCRDPVFVTSQPWPFPTSLMIGFHAVSDGGEPRVRDGELEEVRWATLGDVRDALSDRSDAELSVPPSVSIARHLIARWVVSHGG